MQQMFWAGIPPRATITITIFKEKDEPQLNLHVEGSPDVMDTIFISQ